MDLRIWVGLFHTDPNKQGGGGRTWELVSRFIWQLPQTTVGLFYSHSANTIYGRVNSVEYTSGVTVVDVDDLLWDFDQARGVTLSNYIHGMGIGTDPNEVNADGEITPEARLLRHEYGHYVQSQKVGPLYLFKYGIPSAARAGWTEDDAEYRSDQYFLENENVSPHFEAGYPRNYTPVNPEWWEYAIFFGSGVAGGAGGYVIGGLVVSGLNIER